MNNNCLQKIQLFANCEVVLTQIIDGVVVGLFPFNRGSLIEGELIEHA